MKLTKILVVTLVGCSVLTGCGMQDSNVYDGDNSTQQVNETPDPGAAHLSKDVQLENALANSTISCGTISSKEKNISITYFVMDDKISLSGTYDGEEFDSDLTDDSMEQFLNEIVNYSPTVQEKAEDYWPHTEEYPDMETLFRYNVIFDNEYQYRMDGANCYPDGWNAFIDRIIEISNLS